MQLDYTLDPSITDEEAAAAHAARPAPFPDVDAQDDLEALLAHALTVVPALPQVALANAKHLTDANVFVGVGMCLKTVHDYWDVPALWPDAETAWENGAPIHRETDPMKIPRGTIPYWTNGRHGHVASGVGGGLCRTTDFRRNGFVDLAPIAALGPWCGGQLVGWAETLNGFDVWPDPAKPMPTRPPFGLAEKERLVRNALRRARANGAGQRRIHGLEEWHQHLKDRLAAQ